MPVPVPQTDIHLRRKYGVPAAANITAEKRQWPVWSGFVPLTTPKGKNTVQRQNRFRKIRWFLPAVMFWKYRNLMRSDLRNESNRFRFLHPMNCNSVFRTERNKLYLGKTVPVRKAGQRKCERKRGRKNGDSPKNTGKVSSHNAFAGNQGSETQSGSLCQSFHRFRGTADLLCCTGRSLHQVHSGTGRLGVCCSLYRWGHFCPEYQTSGWL